MDENINGEPQYGRIDEEIEIAANGSTGERGHVGHTIHGVRGMILESFVKYHENRRRHFIDNRCEKRISIITQEAQERAIDKFHTPVYEIME